MPEIEYASLVLGLVISFAITLVAVVFGYEIGRSARAGQPLFRLPKFKRPQPPTSQGRQYKL